MAQLKDLLVTGATRLIGDAFTNAIQITTINAPTSAGGTTYGPGADGKVLKSNGSSIYWADDSNNTYTLSDLNGIGTINGGGTAPLSITATKSGTTVTLGGSISTATTAANGIMTSAMVTKLNGIATGATANTAATAAPPAIGAATTGTSTNYARQDHTHALSTINADILAGGYLNIHPENSPVLIPFIHNDIAFLTQRGGSVSSTYDGNAMTYTFDKCFDGSGSYFMVNSDTYSTLVITLNLHKTFAYGNIIYIDFGNAGWRAKSIKIETNKDSSATWTERYNTTTNNLGHVYVNASTGSTGFNQLRFTLTDWNNTNRRIAQIGIYNYGSSGLRETYMSRGLDDPIFRNITPNSNNTYNLGSTSNKWANVYATTFTGDLTGTATSASSLSTTGTTSQFWRGDNTWAAPFKSGTTVPTTATLAAGEVYFKYS